MCVEVVLCNPKLFEFPKGQQRFFWMTCLTIQDSSLPTNNCGLKILVCILNVFLSQRDTELKFNNLVSNKKGIWMHFHINMRQKTVYHQYSRLSSLNSWRIGCLNSDKRFPYKWYHITLNQIFNKFHINESYKIQHRSFSFNYTYCNETIIF